MDNSCLKNSIKPIIGLVAKIGENKIYLYAKNYDGYLNLLKINTKCQLNELSIVDLKVYKENIICVMPYDSKDIYTDLKKVYKELYIAYGNDYEKKNALILGNNILYVNEVRMFDFSDVKYLGLLREIDTGEETDLALYGDSYLSKEVSEED